MLVQAVAKRNREKFERLVHQAPQVVQAFEAGPPMIKAVRALNESISALEPNSFVMLLIG